MEKTIETIITYKGETYKAIKYEDSGVVRVLAFEKIRMLNDHHKPYSITTSYEVTEKLVIGKATLLVGGEVFNGTRAVSLEKEGEDAFALAETFAISRAASLFLGLEVEISSAEELSPEIVSDRKTDITQNLKKVMDKKEITPPVSEQTKTNVPATAEIATDKWTEENLISLKVDVPIHRILSDMNINPSLLPQKNTNAKMRALILANQEGKLKEHIVSLWGEETYDEYIKETHDDYVRGGEIIETETPAIEQPIRTTITADKNLEKKADEILKETKLPKTISKRKIIDFKFDNIPSLNKGNNRTGADNEELNILWTLLDKAFGSDEVEFEKYVGRFGLKYKKFEEFILHASVDEFELLFKE